MAEMDPIPLALKPAETIVQMASGLWMSRAIWAACRLGIAEAVGEQPIGIDELAQKTGTSRDMLRRLLNALTAHGVFARRADGKIAHNELSLVLRRDHPNSQRAFLDIVFGDEHYEAWGIIDQTVRSGATAFDICYGVPIFGYFGQHPDRAFAFSQAMTNSTRMIENAIMAAHQFKPFDLAVDVGGSQGSLLRALLARHPGARGIIFDLPEIVDGVGATLDGTGITVEGGDFFQSIIAGGDLYLMKFILHDWTDEQCALILKNLRRAIRPGGRLALFEMVLPDGAVPHPGWFMDLNMMAMTGGRERTVAEYDALLAPAGFRIEKVTRTASPISVIEAVTA